MSHTAIALDLQAENIVRYLVVEVIYGVCTNDFNANANNLKKNDLYCHT